MMARLWAAGTVLAVGLLLGTTTARGEDVFRLNLPPSDDAPAMKLGQADTDADTLLTWGRGGFHGGGFRGGFHGGYRGWGGYRGGFVGGYRGWGGGYRGWGGGYRGWGGYGGYYGGYGGYGGYYGGYYPSYYGGYNGCYYPSYSYSSYYYPSYYSCYPSYAYYGLGGYCGISGTDEQVPVFTLNTAPPGSAGATLTPGALPSAQSQTFDYNGGPPALPANPAPLPAVNPARPAPNTLPLEGRPASLPLKAEKKYTYPAYGESTVPPATVPADPTLRLVNR